MRESLCISVAHPPLLEQIIRDGCTANMMVVSTPWLKGHQFIILLCQVLFGLTDTTCDLELVALGLAAQYNAE